MRSLYDIVMQEGCRFNAAGLFPILPNCCGRTEFLYEIQDLLLSLLAGTTSIANATQPDTVFGYQLVTGVDYRPREALGVGLKLRWADFGEFEHEREWDQLRSHDSARSPGGTRVRYKLMSEDHRFLSLGLNLKYHF